MNEVVAINHDSPVKTMQMVEELVGVQAGHGHSHHEHALDKEFLVCGVNITPLIILLALGIHSIFEGIALGLVKDRNVFIDLMIGVVLHHIAATISLGVSLGQHKTKSRLAIFFIFFGLSFIESGGIAIGIGLSSMPDLFGSLVLALAGGTFVYIACSEILVHEFGDPEHRFAKFGFFIFGAIVITVLWFLSQGA